MEVMYPVNLGSPPPLNLNMIARHFGSYCYTPVQINLNIPQINQKIQYFFEQSILFTHNAYFSLQISCD